MIGYLKKMVVGEKRKPTRAQVLASRPIRNPAVEWTRGPKPDGGGTSLALLQIPRRRDRWGNLMARMMRLPDFRKLELDEIGSDVWEMCDGSNSVEAITKAVVTQYRLNRRQAETSVTAYLRQLAERRLIAIRVGGAGGAGDGGGGRKRSEPTNRRGK